MSVAIKNKPMLWKRIVEDVKRDEIGGTRAGQWSARKAQIAVSRYKKAGGGYIGKKSPSNSLSRWSKQKWRTKSGKPSHVTGERYLPEKAIKSLSDKEYKLVSSIKRRDMRKGRQFSRMPKSISKKVKRFR